MDSNDCCYHAVLGVTDDVTQSELRRAYRARLLRAHPDHGGTREELQKVIKAFTELRNQAAPDLPTISSPLQAPMQPRRNRGFSVIAARRYAQQSTPSSLNHNRGTAPHATDTPEPDAPAGSFAAVLQRAVRRVERFQVEILQPDYSS